MNPLPNRPTLRVSEVAYYYGVSERCVYMWIAHGKLKTEHTPGGQKRITRDSFDNCRLGNPAKKSLNNFTS
jgi:excisionase family DNA binding protein